MRNKDYKLYRIVVKDRFDSRDRTIVLVDTPYGNRGYISSFFYGEEGGFLEFDEKNMSALFDFTNRALFDEHIARTKSAKDALRDIISSEFSPGELYSKEIGVKLNLSLSLCS